MHGLSWCVSFKQRISTRIHGLRWKLNHRSCLAQMQTSIKIPELRLELDNFPFALSLFYGLKNAPSQVKDYRTIIISLLNDWNSKIRQIMSVFKFLVKNNSSRLDSRSVLTVVHYSRFIFILNNNERNLLSLFKLNFLDTFWLENWCFKV